MSSWFYWISAGQPYVSHRQRETDVKRPMAKYPSVLQILSAIMISMWFVHLILNCSWNDLNSSADRVLRRELWPSPQRFEYPKLRKLLDPNELQIELWSNQFRTTPYVLFPQVALFIAMWTGLKS